ncbi:MAG: heme exporter protein CcmD [Rickettsiales bacterium]
MENLLKALEMGEYGGYIWSSYLVAAVIILFIFVVTLRSLRKSQKTLDDLQNNEAKKNF